nr:hypothetical protein [Tanacetum cinerariifolium]
MAIDLYSENSGTGSNIPLSPRISFSHDLSNSDTIPAEQLLRSLSSTSSTTDFNFCVQQNLNNHQHADELFSDGKFLSTQSKHHPQPPLPPTPPPVSHNSSKSFWGFKRSSSCGNANGYARSLCPIPVLNRSNSTGSNTNTNTNTHIKRSSSKESGSQRCHHGSQKPPLRKTRYGYGNAANGVGVRVYPVLNLGFGSFFSSGKKK